jgi:predicted ATPase/DNA-binding CsgD family transcriptional regulator
VTGPGGVGKTRIALAVAQRWDVAQDVHVVELASITDASQIAPAVAVAVGVSDQSNRDAVDKVVDHLAGAPSLLVIDNCEHLVEGTARLLLRLLTDLPGLSVLATSRTALVVRGEKVHRLDPLPVPSGAPEESRQLTEVPAVRLLLDRARNAVPDFEITDANRDAVVTLCRRLDGLPLAIELAAVRLRSLTVSQLVERLDGHLHTLAALGGTAEPRQQSLRMLIDWSFDLCTPTEQLLWARMSVFPAPVDLEAIEAVCGHGQLSDSALIDALDGLVGKSVLMTERDNELMRYRQFVPLREYGADKLDSSGDTERIRRLHRDYYITVAAATVDRWFGPDQAGDLARLQRDHPNLVHALSFSFETSGEAAAGARLASLLRYHWIAGGFLTYGRRWLERLLPALDQDSAERGDALWVLAWVALLQGDRSSPRQYLAESSAIAERLGDLAMQGHAAHWTAAQHLLEGDLPEAIEQYRHAIGLHRSAGDVASELTAAYQLGLAETYAGLAHQALSTAASVVERALAAGESWNYGYACYVEALNHLQVGEVERAREAILATMRIECDFNDGVCSALSIEVCSWVAVAMGRAADAAALSGLAARVWQRLGTSLEAFGPHVSSYGRRYNASIVAALGADRVDTIRKRNSDIDLDDVARLAIELLAPGDAEDEDEDGDGLAIATDCTLDTLTGRERDVALLIAEGLSNQQIADALVLSRRTVEGHVERLLRKLEVRSRTQVAVWVAGQ